MKTQYRFQFSLGTLLRCITFVAFFTIAAKLFYGVQDPFAQRALRFCWSAMGVGAVLCFILLMRPYSTQAKEVRFRVLQTHPTRRDQYGEILVGVVVAAAIVVGVSLFCSWTSGLRKNRGPLPLSPLVFGAVSGFAATVFLALTSRQWVLLGEEGIDGMFPLVRWKEVESAYWIDRSRGILRIVRRSESDSTRGPIDVEVPERRRDQLEQFLCSKTDLVSS